MDRKVLLAMVMIMMVLLVDQVISPRYYKAKPKPAPVPAGQGTAAVRTTDSSAATAPVTTSTSTVPQGGTLSSGATLTQPVVAAAPTETREIRTEHYTATLTTDGGAITHWVLPGYKDEIRNGPLALVDPGARAYPVVVEYGGHA